MTLPVLSLIAVILLWPAGGIAAGLALVAAQHLILSSCCDAAALPLQLLMLAFILAAPLAARIAGWLVESAALPEGSRDTLNGAALVLALSVQFGSGQFGDLYAAGVDATVSGRAGPVALTLIALLNSVIFCAAVVAFSLLTVNLIIEVPLAWLTSAARVRARPNFAPLRPLVILTVATLGFQLILGSFDANLAPSFFRRPAHTVKTP
jgi:hypothetical protein